MPKSAKIPNVRFNLKQTPKDKSDPKWNEPILIYAIFRYNGQRLKYSTGQKVIGKYWDLDNQKAKNVKNHPEYLGINDELQELSKMIRSIFKEYNLGKITPEEFRYQLKLREGRIQPKVEPKDTPPTFFEFIEKYIELRKNDPKITRGTWKVQLTCQNHLKAYALTCGYVLDFDTIDWDFRHDFENWMYNTKKHSINYASKMITEVTHFLREAKKRKLYKGEIFTEKGWHIKKKEYDKKFALSFDELDQLNNHDFSENKKLERVRDLFLIGAYSGLRFSDFSRIRPKHMIEEDGIEMIEISTQKTDSTVTIPLVQVMKELLEKYEYNPPKISIQKFNDYLKEACKEAGIDRMISFSTYNGAIKENHRKSIHEIIGSHNARRSFATNFYKLGIPAIHIMSITGHASESQFMKYICIEGRENAKQIAKEVAIRMRDRKLKVV